MSRRSRRLLALLLTAAFVLVALDALRPVLLRRDLAAVAREAAAAAERSYLSNGSPADAAVAARRVTDRRKVALVGYAVLVGGRIRVTVGGDAGSYVLTRIPPLHRYDTVEVSATASAAVGSPAPDPASTIDRP